MLKLTQTVFRKVGSHTGARNFLWLVTDKALRLIAALFVGSWVARYLGEAQFGLFAYVSAWIAIVTAVASLGMEALVVRDIIKQPHEAGRMLGTTMSFRAGANLLGSIVIWSLVRAFRPEDPLAWSLLAILATGAIVQSLESGELWFQSQVDMRRLVVPRLGLFVVMNVIKVLLIIKGASLIAFVSLTALEISLSGIMTLLMVRYSRGGCGPLSIDLGWGRQMLRECWPLAMSGLVVILYMKITQLLLSSLLDDAALGVYSAASRVSEAANFIPMILASSLLPWFVQHREQGPEPYRVARLRLFRLNAFIGLWLSLLLSLGAPLIIHILYGGKFLPAAPVLAVHAWTLVFIFLGVARAQYYLNERNTRWPLRFTIWGLIVNVGSSLFLIPQYGPQGAAWAVVLAQAIASVGTSFISPETRQIGREQLHGLLTPWRFFQAIK